MNATTIPKPVTSMDFYIRVDGDVMEGTLVGDIADIGATGRLHTALIAGESDPRFVGICDAIVALSDAVSASQAEER